MPPNLTPPLFPSGGAPPTPRGALTPTPRPTQVGVDLNRAAMFPWLSHTVQYVSGLGPRKASALLREAASHEGGFEDRVDLRRSTFLAPQRVVFRNASPFLRIREVGPPPATTTCPLPAHPRGRAPSCHRHLPPSCASAR